MTKIGALFSSGKLLPPRTGRESEHAMKNDIVLKTSGYLLFGFLLMMQPAVAQTFIDSFEGTTLNPFWSIEDQQNATYALSPDRNHSGSQSLKLIPLSGGNRHMWLTHHTPAPNTGTVSVWFYDSAPGAATLYSFLYLQNTTVPVNAPGFRFAIGVTDYEPNRYVLYAPSDLVTNVPRTLGWHNFKISFDGAGVQFVIDGVTVLTQAGLFAFDKVTLNMFGPGGSPATTFYFDDFTLTTPSNVSDQAGPITSNVSATPNPLPIGSAVTITATVDDSMTGGSNIASATYTINSGSDNAMTAQDGMFDETTEAVAASSTVFTAPGVYTICVRGADTAGNTGESECIPVPVYDPNGGFVTGGGTILSPVGADYTTPSASGPAHFGFVAKYVGTGGTPSGNLEFQFNEGDLHFKSTSMDWLVVTGEPRHFPRHRHRQRNKRVQI